MKVTTRVFVAAVAFFGMAVAGATASPISQFNKTTNDGVYSLSASQAAALGYASADYIGFFRVRDGNGTTFSSGDTFDASTMFNSVTSGSGDIIAFLNGRNSDLSYDGTFLQALGTTTVGVGTSYYEGVAFLFSGVGSIVFKGSSTFNAGQTRGDFDGVGIVPVPAALPLLLSGLFGLGGIRMLRRRQLRSTSPDELAGAV